MVWKNLYSRWGRSSHFVLLLVVAATMLVPLSEALAGSGGKEMQWGTMTMTLLGGLALFLFGMEQMADALKAVAGERMKNILATLTTNRVTGAMTGAFVTAIIQSSSVTTVLVVGFVTAGLMSTRSTRSKGAWRATAPAVMPVPTQMTSACRRSAAASEGRWPSRRM